MQTSEWPSSYIPILGCSEPQWDREADTDGRDWRGKQTQDEKENARERKLVYKSCGGKTRSSGGDARGKEGGRG